MNIMCSLMQKYQFRQIVRGVTTNNNTTIDLIFVNFDDYKSVGELKSTTAILNLSG